MSLPGATRRRTLLFAIVSGLLSVTCTPEIQGPVISQKVQPLFDQLGGFGYEPGGSHFHFLSIAQSYWEEDNPGAELWKPSVVQVPLGNFHVGNNQDVLWNRLYWMSQNGQRKITIPIRIMREDDICASFLTAAECSTGLYDYDGDETWQTMVFAHRVSPTQWTLSNQVLDNLEGLLGFIGLFPFNEVIIRFSPQGALIDPTVCAAWYDQDTPQALWALERGVIDRANAAYVGRNIKLTYDLGLEWAGYQRTDTTYAPTCGGRILEAQRYVWHQYACRATKYGGWPHVNWTAEQATAHTVGFSFAGRLRRHGPDEYRNMMIYDQTVDVYDYVTQYDAQCAGRWRPATYAFDIYPIANGNWGLDNCSGSGCLDWALWDEIGHQLIEIGNFYQPIALYEVPYYSTILWNGIYNAIRYNCLNIRTVMQWEAYWDGATAPTMGTPPREVHWNIASALNYIYTGFDSCWTG
jgi:hypothetical protein